jgi:two-component system, cell cycle sensor histidine kinase and response regulator CckA
MVELLKFSVSKHAVLTINLGRDLPAIQAGAGQLRQIVMNLVTNASDAIGESDGVIYVTTEWVTVGRDRPWFLSEDLPEGDYVRLEVSDTGCGMPAEMQAKVFDPFFTTKSAGHGLGLAVVQGTVRSLHGTVRVESEPGRGTTFEILLPCSRTRVVADQSATFLIDEPRAGRRSHEGTVLIVEDEDSLRLPISNLLRKAHFSVIEASDGSAALEAIRAHTSPIDILFLDITLPGTPSRTVFEEATRLRRDMSLIVTSAYSQAVAEERLGGKIQCFLRKPYRVDDLVGLVRQTLSR